MADRPGPASWPIVAAILIVVIAVFFTEQVGSEVATTATAVEESTHPPVAVDDSSEGHAVGTPTMSASSEPVVAPSPTESRSPTEDDFAAAELADQLAAALAERNIDVLLDLLHPVVFETYPREECVAHLESSVGGIAPLRLGRVTGTGSYEYVTSNRTTAEVEDAVFVVLVFDTESGPQEEHSQFAWADGSLRWFTHCSPGA